MDGFQQQAQAQAAIQLGAVKASPVIHSEPNDLYDEICRRLEHYNTEMDKLEHELRKLRIMRDVLAVAQNAFDKQEEPSI